MGRPTTSDLDANKILIETRRTSICELSNSREINSGSGWRRHFESLPGRQAIVLFYLFILHIHYPMRAYYCRKYGSLSSSEEQPDSSDQLKQKCQPPVVVTSGGCDASLEPSAKNSHSHFSEVRPPPLAKATAAWNWRAFPRMSRALVCYRVVTSVVMFYVLIKSVCPAALEAPLRLLNLSKPPGCYALGKFMPNVGIRRALGALFALYHLGWRHSQIYAPRRVYTIDVLYFLLFDDRDIAHYYELFKQLHYYRGVGYLTRNRAKRSRQRLPLTSAGDQQQVEDKREMMFHDVMSLRVDHRKKLLHKLRPNRTPAASRLLRKYLTDVTLIGIVIFVPLALTVTTLMMWEITKTQRYLDDYPGCSLELQELYSHNLTRASSGDWHLHLRGHQILASLVDICINAVLWSESGLAIIFVMPFALLINHDLILNWKYLDDKFSRISKELQNNFHKRSTTTSELLTTRQEEGARGPSARLTKALQKPDGSMHELLMEWQDFIKQIKHADAFIGDYITMALMIWFSMFVAFIYDFINNHKDGPPLVLTLTMIAQLALVTALCMGLLGPHRYCLTSYTKFCSLMAYDRSEQRAKFIHALEYFTEKQTCYTLCRRKKMTAATYLTIIGWSCSCFFILASSIRR